MKQLFVLLSVALAAPVATQSAQTAAQPAASAAAAQVVRGAITPKVTCASDPRFSYALFLPTDFDPGREWPVLFLFDPRGRGVVAAEIFKAAAIVHGLVIVSSNDTRSDDPKAPNNEAVMATWADAHARLKLDAKRQYAGGFSGGARIAARVGAALQGGLAGVIAVGAGLPGEANPKSRQHFSLFGAVGETDFNYTELRQLEEQLRASSTPSRVVAFDGGHEWLPPSLALEALDWLALRAMGEDRRATDPQIVERYRASVANRAAAFEKQGRIGEALRAWEGLADDLAGFGGSTAAVKEVERLGSAARKELERERTQATRDREWSDKAMRTLATLAQSPPPPLAQLVQELDVARLQKLAADPDRITSLSAERRISAAAVQANFYLPTAFKAQGQLQNALVAYQLAAALDPKSPYPHVGEARVHALAGRKRESIAALREALRKGFARPAAALADDPELASLGGEPGFEAILEELRKASAGGA